MMTSSAVIDDILQFWFGDPNDAEAMRPSLWFQGGEHIDIEIRTRFHDLIEQAGLGRLDAWKQTARGRLAWTLLLDQFTRNAYRDTIRMYVFDTIALQSTREAVASGQHKELNFVQRAFLYLPLEHSEELAAQEEAVALFGELAEEAKGTPMEEAMAGMLDFAVRHERVVRRFGRFPHRNAIYSRQSTAEEVSFLASDAAPF